MGKSKRKLSRNPVWRHPYHSITDLDNLSWFQVIESESEITQSCPTLRDPMDCSLPGFSVHGIFQARMLEWVVISFSRWSSQPRDQTQVSRTTGRFFTDWATREVQFKDAKKEAARNLPGSPEVETLRFHLQRCGAVKKKIKKKDSWKREDWIHTRETSSNCCCCCC